jgi:hypothetical protein
VLGYFFLEPVTIYFLGTMSREVVLTDFRQIILEYCTQSFVEWYGFEVYGAPYLGIGDVRYHCDGLLHMQLMERLRSHFSLTEKHWEVLTLANARIAGSIFPWLAHVLPWLPPPPQPISIDNTPPLEPKKNLASDYLEGTKEGWVYGDLDIIVPEMYAEDVAHMLDPTCKKLKVHENSDPESYIKLVAQGVTAVYKCCHDRFSIDVIAVAELSIRRSLESIRRKISRIERPWDSSINKSKSKAEPQAPKSRVKRKEVIVSDSDSESKKEVIVSDIDSDSDADSSSVVGNQSSIERNKKRKPKRSSKKDDELPLAKRVRSSAVQGLVGGDVHKWVVDWFDFQFLWCTADASSISIENRHALATFSSDYHDHIEPDPQRCSLLTGGDDEKKREDKGFNVLWLNEWCLEILKGGASKAVKWGRCVKYAVRGAKILGFNDGLGAVFSVQSGSLDVVTSQRCYPKLSFHISDHSSKIRSYTLKPNASWPAELNLIKEHHLRDVVTRTFLSFVDIPHDIEQIFFKILRCLLLDGFATNSTPFTIRFRDSKTWHILFEIRRHPTSPESPPLFLQILHPSQS